MDGSTDASTDGSTLSATDGSALASTLGSIEQLGSAVVVSSPDAARAAPAPRISVHAAMAAISRSRADVGMSGVSAEGSLALER
jgi:hypothetical protein